MRVDPPSFDENSRRPSPMDPAAAIHPLGVLSLAISLAVASGLLAGWDAGATVLCSVLSFLSSIQSQGDDRDSRPRSER